MSETATIADLRNVGVPNPEMAMFSGDVLGGAARAWTQSLQGQPFGRVVGQAGLSAVWGVSPLPEGPADAFAGAIKNWAGGGKVAKFGSKLLSQIPRGVRKVAQGVGRWGMRWAGPAITAYRLGTETKGLSAFGKVEKGTRIIGEEVISTAGFFAGMPIGALLGGALTGALEGGALGATLGSIAPGVGNVVGFVAGAAIGMGLAAAGSWAWNKVVDVAAAPAKIPGQAYRFMRDLGKRSTRLELGGGVSAANRTRAAHTMRQRHLMAMNKSGMNARSLLGREASMMHIRSMT